MPRVDISKSDAEKQEEVGAEFDALFMSLDKKTRDAYGQSDIIEKCCEVSPIEALALFKAWIAERSKPVAMKGNRSMEWFAKAVKSGQLSKPELAVLSVIMAHMNGDTGQAYPSVNTIAELVGSKPNKVREWRDRIIELGFIDKIERGNQSCCYTMTLPSELAKRKGLKVLAGRKYSDDVPF